MAFLDLTGLTRFTTKMKTWVNNHAVLFGSQTLSDAQKEQARTNIGAADIDDVVKLSSQSPSTAQKSQARTNIGAADIDDVVKLSAQTPTNAQKTQARTNIGAASTADITAINTATSTTFDIQTNKITNRGSYAFKFGKLVFVNIAFDITDTITTSTTLYKIPSGYRPASTVKSMNTVCASSASGYAVTRGGIVEIDASGNVTQKWSSLSAGWISALFIYSV